MANQLEALAERRAALEALRNALLHQGRAITECACWHHDTHGLEKLQDTLGYMQQLAARMHETLEEIQRLERALMAP